MGVDLHRLANEGGYGAASKALQDAGLWNPYAVSDEEGKYVVRVSAMMPVFATIIVTARSEEEAQELAENQAADPMFSWSEFGDVDDLLGIVE